MEQQRSKQEALLVMHLFWLCAVHVSARIRWFFFFLIFTSTSSDEASPLCSFLFNLFPWLCWYVEILEGGFQRVFVSLLLTTMIEGFLWQTFLRHPGNMACPSELCQFQKSMYTLHPCPFQDFCVWNPPGVSLTLCCFAVFFTRRFVLCLTLCYFVLVFFSPFSIAITSLGEESANLSAFRTFVRFALVWFCLSWCLGRAAVCDCGTPWTFLLPFFRHLIFKIFLRQLVWKWFSLWACRW